MICDGLLAGGTSLGVARRSYTVRWTEECGVYCRKTEGCTAFSYDTQGKDERTHACLLFGPATTSEYKPGWVSGTRNAQPSK
jgi:hypothetical protein